MTHYTIVPISEARRDVCPKTWRTWDTTRCSSWRLTEQPVGRLADARVRVVPMLCARPIGHDGPHSTWPDGDGVEWDPEPLSIPTRSGIWNMVLDRHGNLR